MLLALSEFVEREARPLCCDRKDVANFNAIPHQEVVASNGFKFLFEFFDLEAECGELVIGNVGSLLEVSAPPRPRRREACA